MCIAFLSGGLSAFGMNLTSGLEGVPFSFYGVCGLSLMATAIMYYRLLRYMRGDFSKTIETRQVAERKFLESVFLDIEAVDIAINSAMHQINDINGKGHMTKNEFVKLFKDVKGTEEVDLKEVDALFSMLDANVDGILYKGELKKVITAKLDDVK
jgi:hypothetical protein